MLSPIIYAFYRFIHLDASKPKAESVLKTIIEKTLKVVSIRFYFSKNAQKIAIL